MTETRQNMIETALAAAQKPFLTNLEDGTPVVMLPQDGGWEMNALAVHRNTPARKKGTTYLHDAGSLIKFVEKHKQEGTEIYIDADFARGNIKVEAIINGHTAAEAGFGDFGAVFCPSHTPAANVWIQHNKKTCSQMEFAALLNQVARDIVSQNPAEAPEAQHKYEDPIRKYPTAAEVLDFALNLEYTQKTTFKQFYREQDGKVNLTFASEDAGKTEEHLKMFEKFGISFTPFLNGDSYFVEARLFFRVDKNNGALLLWYELQQIDRVMEDAARDIAAKLQQAFTDTPIYFGIPK